MSQSIPVKEGWNWFSLNLWNDDFTAAKVLGSLTDATDAFVKNLQVCVCIAECGNW